MLNKAEIDKIREEAIAWVEIEFRNVDEFSRNDLELCVKSFIAARAATPPAPAIPVGYFELPVRSGSTYREVDPKYQGDPDVVPLYRDPPPAPAPSTLAAQVAHAQKEMAKWSPEVRASVRLEGGDGAATEGQADTWRKLGEDDKPDAARRLDVVLWNGCTESDRHYTQIDWTAVVDWRYSGAVPRQAAVADEQPAHADVTLPSLGPGQSWCCGGCGSGVIKNPRRIEFEYSREEFPDGRVISMTTPHYVAPCCGGELNLWDDNDQDYVRWSYVPAAASLSTGAVSKLKRADGEA